MEEISELEADELTLAIAVSSGIWSAWGRLLYDNALTRTDDPAAAMAAASSSIAYATAAHLQHLRAAIKSFLTCPACGGRVGCVNEGYQATEKVLDILERNRVYLGEKDEAELSEVKQWLLRKS